MNLSKSKRSNDFNNLNKTTNLHQNRRLLTADGREGQKPQETMKPK